MGLKTQSQHFSCTMAKDKDTAGQVIPTTDTWCPQIPVKIRQTLLEFADTAIATCCRKHFPRTAKDIAWFPTSQPLVTKHDRLEFHIIANNNTRACRLKKAVKSM